MNPGANATIAQENNLISLIFAFGFKFALCSGHISIALKLLVFAKAVCVSSSPRRMERIAVLAIARHFSKYCLALVHVY